MKILVAEDNDFNRNLICAVVEIEGGEVIAARDGVEALREMNARPVDLVLMDLNMPRLDGRQALREMRRSDLVIAKLPVIALTAEVFEDDDHGLLEEGFDRALFKPLDEVLLINTIVELLAGSLDRTEQIQPVTKTKRSFLSALPAEILEQEIARQLRLLSVAQQNQDVKGVREQAHQLRSVLYGVEDSEGIVAMVQRLELACDGADIEGITGVFLELEKKLRRSSG